ncbi:MAG: hypothetical protein KBC84_11105, partial [Proteobacteria bacterium]|nr:hypothetical protein [Pseudomonadota bacterium]
MKYYLLSLLWLFCITTSAHAGTVAFQISASSTFSETETILNFTFKNLGNDTANKFSAKVIQGEKTFTSEVIEGIAPSMEYKITLKVDSSAYKDKGAYTEAVY